MLGVPLLILLSYLLGGWRTAQLEDEAHVLRCLAEDEPEFEAARVVLSRDRRCALATDRDVRRLGVVRAAGDRFAVRVIRPGEIRRARLDPQDRSRLRIVFRDFTFPPLRVRLSDERAAAAWLELLAAFETSRDGSS